MVEVLKRDRAMVPFGLAGVAILSWIYLICVDCGMRRMDVGMRMVIMPAMEDWTSDVGRDDGPRCQPNDSASERSEVLSQLVQRIEQLPETPRPADFVR